MWNDRYNRPDYLFGTAPAQFTRAHAHRLRAGQSLVSLADGEGRNSVYLAQQGVHVTALETSAHALEKARALAQAGKVRVDFQAQDITQFDWAAQSYDAVLAVFIQFSAPPLQGQIFDAMIRATAPGGLILLHGYSEAQLGFGTGGPRVRENLYSETLLRRAFAGLNIEYLHSYEAELDEGSAHNGPSALIDMIARKPS